ncbi:hypothetical protein Rhopal_000034-T1 [Rhodotorula paludigena]|uniref:MFS general substrate transporter n=1 Tax=Rhodotorula paludigena TaxID=86838 RepID=A0AAV5GB77_9BASI|nr:hypothetical protein Rhopal_000034-T1 [Rhodotorula paludigena]
MSETMVAGSFATPDEHHAAGLPHTSTLDTRLQKDDKISRREKRDSRTREFSCYWAMFIAGWSDASSGPLIPYIQAHYGLTYSVVSLLFLGFMAGYLAAAILCPPLTARFGIGKVIVVGACFQAIGFGLLIAAFPFPVFPVLFATAGFGVAFQSANSNVFFATLPKAEKRLSFLHGVYGLGGAVCPLAATAFASSGILFSRFYAISLGMSVINIAVLTYAFKFNYRTEGVDAVSTATSSEATRAEQEHGLELNAIGSAAALEPRSGETSGEIHAGAAAPIKTGGWNSTSMRAARHRITWTCAPFIMLYVGAEVSMGGWIVTFLMENRSGGADAGYVATGFWLGIMVGRIISIPLNLRVGEKRIIYLYIIAALALETGSISIIAAIGQVGSASMPFLLTNR